MPVIELAFEGKMEMLKACFGSGEATPAPDAERVPEQIPAKKAMGIFRLLAGKRRK